MTLQQQALFAVQQLPDEKLPALIEFARFLQQSAPASAPVPLERRRRLAGILKGQVRMAEDFNETPDVFREYL